MARKYPADFKPITRGCLPADDTPLPYSSKDPEKGISKDGPNDQMPGQNNAGTSWHHLAEIALTAAQQAGQTVTYAELADAAKIPNPQRIHKLTAWLETTMRSDHAGGKPLRAALVISRNRGGLPAPGFFILCAELDLYQGASSGQQAAKFHQTAISDLWGMSDT